MKKVVGKVTDEEKLAIWGINEHKNSLEELLLSIPINCELYMQVTDDLNNTITKYQEWWNQCYNKYQWEKGDDDWKIIFHTNEIIIEL